MHEIENRDTYSMMENCKKHMYQPIQLELTDGSVYQGILHSYDNEKMYMLMPNMSANQQASREDDRFFFPFFGPFGLFGFPFFGVRRFGPFFPFFI
ncbi:hypothetical protein GJU40_14970 [Bacillus lacus]|uniref:Uncharacterized protein n=1 Tax=Metabacillus lacus TaxID=1983721 RepID=A0A7X2LYC9_9BACI|nr:hypothetical protein [Metabacillus lacus]MRX73445.1 hypothetical protein [Metabacillus lacus]